MKEWFSGMPSDFIEREDQPIRHHIDDGRMFSRNRKWALTTANDAGLVNTFGATDPAHIVPTVSQVSPKFLYLAIGTGLAAFLQVSCWMVTGERQATRIRGLYLKTILRQDIGFFDTQTNTGEIIGRMSGDTILIQNAMGEKVGKFIQLLSTFLGGFVIAFLIGWLLTLVLLSCIPALVIAGGVMSIVVSKMSTRGQRAYAEAGTIVEQTVGAIRTVASFTGEKQAIDKYTQKLKIAYNNTVQQGLATGVGLGAFMLIVFSTYGLAIWYGSKMIIEKGYNGGQVINVLFAMTSGGMEKLLHTKCLRLSSEHQQSILMILLELYWKMLKERLNLKMCISGILLGQMCRSLQDSRCTFRVAQRLLWLGRVEVGSQQ